jgi:hypothetical protein
VLIGLVWFDGVLRYFQQYFSNIVAVSIIGGGNRTYNFRNITGYF